MSERQSRSATTRPLIGPSQEDVPPAKLPSVEQVLQLISWNRQQPASKNKPVYSFCCDMNRDKTAVCLNDGGCVARGVPCLLYKVKRWWIKAGFDTVTDFRIREKLKEAQDAYNIIFRHRDRKSAPEVKKRTEYLESIKKSFDISDPNARILIVNDKNRSERAKKEDLEFFDDYLGKYNFLIHC